MPQTSPIPRENCLCTGSKACIGLYWSQGTAEVSTGRYYDPPGAQLPALAFTLNTGLTFAALFSEAGRATSDRPISVFICIMVAAIDPDNLCYQHSRLPSSFFDLNFFDANLGPYPMLNSDLIES